MRVFAGAIVLACALVGTAAQAQPMRGDMTQVCGQEARKQGLRGQALADFLTRCWAGQAPGAPGATVSCEEEARRQTLSGEDLSNFMRRCQAGQVTLPAATDDPNMSCEDKARRRGLSGTALTDFMRRCRAGEVPLPTASETARQVCEGQAGTLSGEARATFMRSCLARQ